MARHSWIAYVATFIVIGIIFGAIFTFLILALTSTYYDPATLWEALPYGLGFGFLLAIFGTFYMFCKDSDWV